jgi:hypothetical protein
MVSLDYMGFSTYRTPPPADASQGRHRRRHTLDGTDAEACRREKHLVGVVGVIEVEVLLLNRETESSSGLDHHFTADTGEDDR